MTAPARRGTTTVSERAVRRIAEQAAVEALPGAHQDRASGAAATVRGRRAEVSLRVALPYPVMLGDTVRDVQEQVTERTRHLTGLEVATARVAVTSFTRPRSGPLPSADRADPPVPAPRTPRRSWSRRRLPVALVASVTAAGCGALALDMIRVHLSGRTAGAWRTGAVRWLSEHGPGDHLVVAAGGLGALAGLWLLVLALTPGRRRRHTVRAPGPGIDAAVDRSAVSGLVRDAVAGVDGVTAVRVRVRGRRVTVRASLAFGDRAAAHVAATAVARDCLTACRLRRTPRLRVVMTPEPLWRPVAGPDGGGGGGRPAGSADAVAAAAAAAAAMTPSDDGTAPTTSSRAQVRPRGKRRTALPRLRPSVNRTVLGGIGLALLLVGLWLAATERAVASRLPSWWPAPPPDSVLLDREGLAQLRAQTWWTPTAIAVLASLAVLCAWWALAQLRSGSARRLSVGAPGGTVRPQALAEALAARVAALPGVTRCRARVVPRSGDRLEVGLRVWLASDTPPASVLPSLTALATEAGEVLAPRTAHTRVRLSAASHRTPHVR
ncbi:DUF6286 domain-containing Asp23/Gls24 family envelope stress response protein [Streptomyces sp. NPDC004539]|uniref:DUF6286 domain-containing Asp23/Gls24 family envelope stress response protein n=1 Tax=Streptomyces sp. NPDC004539 TaxID=3154280 RepID=UPI0033A0D7E8